MTGGAGYDVVKPLPHTTKVTLQFDAFFERSRADIGTIDRDASGLDGVSVSKAAELEAAGYMDVVAVDAVQPSSVSAIYSAPGLDREVFLAAADLHWDGVELPPHGARTRDRIDWRVRLVGPDRQRSRCAGSPTVTPAGAPSHFLAVCTANQNSSS